MRRTVELVAVCLLAATLALSGCSDAPLPSELADEAAVSFFSREPAPGFDAMKRRVPLPADLTITGTIGPEGGRLEIIEAGVTLVIPQAALSSPTVITMRALAGEAVAFEFAPHGLEFAAPASIRIRAAGTEAEQLLERPDRSTFENTPLRGFLGVYFEGNAGEGAEPVENIETYLVKDALVFSIEHFSGYVSASG
jgi:ZU5 domain